MVLLQPLLNYLKLPVADMPLLQFLGPSPTCSMFLVGLVPPAQVRGVCRHYQRRGCWGPLDTFPESTTMELELEELVQCSGNGSVFVSGVEDHFLVHLSCQSLML